MSDGERQGTKPDPFDVGRDELIAKLRADCARKDAALRELLACDLLAPIVQQVRTALAEAKSVAGETPTWPPAGLEREHGRVGELLEILRDVLDEAAIFAHRPHCAHAYNDGTARFNRSLLLTACPACAGERLYREMTPPKGREE